MKQKTFSVIFRKHNIDSFWAIDDSDKGNNGSNAYWPSCPIIRKCSMANFIATKFKGRKIGAEKIAKVIVKFEK